MKQRRQWQPTLVLLPGKSHGWRSLVGSVHGIAKSRIRLSDFTFTFHFHALEKEMATHSSVLSWRIPGTVEPDGLSSVGLHRVGHDWSDLVAAEVSATEVVAFLEFPCFFNDPKDNICILISCSSAFSKSSLHIWKFLVHMLLKTSLKDIEHYFASM